LRLWFWQVLSNTFSILVMDLEQILAVDLEWILVSEISWLQD
jgi:hypothetical protein